MVNCLCVGLGGFVGSICRYLIGLIPLKQSTAFPVKTLLINVLGAFVIGLLAAWVGKESHLDPRLILLLKVGLCGGFTTFSTFAYESSSLLQTGNILVAVLYISASVLLSILAIYTAQVVVH